MAVDTYILLQCTTHTTVHSANRYILQGVLQPNFHQVAADTLMNCTALIKCTLHSPHWTAQVHSSYMYILNITWQKWSYSWHNFHPSAFSTVLYDDIFHLIWLEFAFFLCILNLFMPIFNCLQCVWPVSLSVCMRVCSCVPFDLSCDAYYSMCILDYVQTSTHLPFLWDK